MLGAEAPAERVGTAACRAAAATRAKAAVLVDLAGLLAAATVRAGAPAECVGTAADWAAAATMVVPRDSAVETAARLG